LPAQWSTQKLADASGFSKSTVHRILNEASLKPHKIDYWCGKSPDPEFAEKQAAIIGLYLNPPENALVISVDEKSQIQALDRTQPMLPMKPENPKRFTHTYTRHGTTCLLAALLVHDGRIEGRCVDRHTHEEFLSFLKHLYRKYPNKELHVIMDNYSAHKHQKVKEWAEKRRRLTSISRQLTLPGSTRSKSGSAFWPEMSFVEAYGTRKGSLSKTSCFTLNAITKKRRPPSNGPTRESPVWLDYISWNLRDVTLAQ
jgi:hypothetical protein